jgi:hypothetical protein
MFGGRNALRPETLRRAADGNGRTGEPFNGERLRRDGFLFDQFICEGKHCRRDRDVHGFGGLEIDDKVLPFRLKYR